MNVKLVSFVAHQRSLNISDEEIIKMLLLNGWDKKEVVLAMKPPVEKKAKSGTAQIIVLGSTLLIVLGLILNVVFRFGSLEIDQSIKNKNDVLLAEIESQEEILHKVLHADLNSGKIPISKELSILFRQSDLLHLQNELMEITDTVNNLQQLELVRHNKALVNKTLSEIRKRQDEVSVGVYDKTHDGTLDPTWFY